ncbi:regulatory phage cox family protein [Enterobacter asburiae]|uniref:regulatory phage cox family protein n=1 Tax=Enterobacter asburiae TaxID=61645 RepID=UPI00217623F1|nr:regulatory phage cox family protein [Enterobacter asburiae]UWA76427.1 regulatory phage cox family protein [Enterobacter asburiae]
MTTNISINLPVPSISKEKYIELTGLPEDTVESMLKDGRLPRHRLRKDMGREKVMINIAALTIDALAGCNIVLN